jgi:predicted metal-dependent phosphoesterase TrpH
LKNTVDLHTHTKHSDGTLTPSELIELAVENELFAIALTDHNTASGLPEFFAAAEGKDIEAVGGTELSCDYDGKEIHIVGLFLELDDVQKIDELMDQMKQNKIISNKNLIEKLASDGYDISYEAVEKTVNGYMNRAHIATYLVSKGYFSSRQEVFEKILQPYGKYYTPPKTISVFEGIEFLNSLGAVSVLAHPYLSIPDEDMDSFLEGAVASGLDAMETVYTTYDEQTARKAKETAEKYGLIESGGSDFHGANKPDTKLGVGYGNIAFTREQYLKLKERKEGKK